mmetsp:Transcript_21347/g.50584  ORF Transcript_21347/g.50584 Transcript_21347/m.50584 type:complete len:349 (+) Transcript_21347:1300-2346(+)
MMEVLSDGSDDAKQSLEHDRLSHVLFHDFVSLGEEEEDGGDFVGLLDRDIEPPSPLRRSFLVLQALAVFGEGVVQQGCQLLGSFPASKESAEVSLGCRGREVDDAPQTFHSQMVERGVGREHVDEDGNALACDDGADVSGLCPPAQTVEDEGSVLDDSARELVGGGGKVAGAEVEEPVDQTDSQHVVDQRSDDPDVARIVSAGLALSVGHCLVDHSERSDHHLVARRVEHLEQRKHLMVHDEVLFLLAMVEQQLLQGLASLHLLVWITLGVELRAQPQHLGLNHGETIAMQSERFELHLLVVGERVLGLGPRAGALLPLSLFLPAQLLPQHKLQRLSFLIFVAVNVQV